MSRAPLALISSLSITVMLPGTAGKFIRSMPSAVVLTILASLLVSLTVIPFLASVFLREEEDEHGWRGVEAVVSSAVERVRTELNHELDSIDAEIRAVVTEAAEFAQNDPEPDASELYTDIYVNA